MKKYLVLLALVIFTNCTQDHESMVKALNGYWEIIEVNKDGEKVKEFKINMNIDYFEVKEDRTGFRKKVAPTLEGTYLISQHQIPFSLKTVGKDLQIQYFENGVAYFETIVKANQDILVIRNEDGFIYTYKPFKRLDLDL